MLRGFIVLDISNPTLPDTRLFSGLGHGRTLVACESVDGPDQSDMIVPLKLVVVTLAMRLRRITTLGRLEDSSFRSPLRRPHTRVVGTALGPKFRDERSSCPASVEL